MIKSFSYRAGRLAGLCLLVVFALAGQDAQAQKDKVRQAEKELETSKSQLEKIEGEIKASDARARGLKKKERSLVRQIHEYERKIDTSRKTLRSLNQEIEDINSEINFISSQLISCAQKLEKKKAVLNLRLRGIYKQGRLHQVAILLGSHSFTDLLKRYKYLTLIAAQDKRLVREVSELQFSYGEYKRASERKLTLRMERKNQLESEQEKLEVAEGERQKLLNTVKAQRAEVLKALKQRRAEAESIRDLIAEWERRRKEAIEQAKREGRELPLETAHLAGKKGKVIWPVIVGKMIRGFGPYVDKITKTRVINNGIDIKADYGENVLTVADGMVMYVDWYRSYGKTIMVDHGQGMYSLYTHLGEVFVSVGDFIAEGRTIARVGSTGSLEGPMLHFEIRNGAKAINPMLWLSKKM